MNDAAIAASLLVGACALAFAALAITRLAHNQGLPQRLGRLLALPPSEAGTVEMLAMLSGLARSEGLLIVEQHPALRRLPVFHAGLRLTLAGQRPVAIREQLARDFAAEPRHSLLSHLPQPVGILAAIAALAMLATAAPQFHASPAAAALLASALLIAAAALSLGTFLAGSAHRDGYPRTLLQIEAAALVAAGAGPAEVRDALLVLQGPEGDPTILRRAA